MMWTTCFATQRPVRRDRVDDRDRALERRRRDPDLLGDLAVERVRQRLARLDAAAGQQPDVAARACRGGRAGCRRPSAGAPRRGSVAPRPSLVARVRRCAPVRRVVLAGALLRVSASLAGDRSLSPPRRQSRLSRARALRRGRRDRREDQEGDPRRRRRAHGRAARGTGGRARRRALVRRRSWRPRPGSSSRRSRRRTSRSSPRGSGAASSTGSGDDR